MKSIVLLISLIGVAAAFSCVGQPTAFFCKGTGFALCVNDAEYDYACAAGTACQCGEGVECDTPCTMACETGSRDTDAWNYCQARLGGFSGEQGYFCDALGGGFYQCVRDAFCPTQASPRSQYIPCPDGTECACGDTTKECSLAGARTPCLWPSDYVPLTTSPQADVQTPHQNALCGDYKWDCINFSQGYSAHACHDDTCGEVGDGGYCFWDHDTNAGVCGGNTWCSDAPACSSSAQCGSGYSCSINTCCGAGGVCIPICNSK